MIFLKPIDYNTNKLLQLKSFYTATKDGFNLIMALDTKHFPLQLLNVIVPSSIWMYRQFM